MKTIACKRCGNLFEQVRGRVLCDDCRIGTCVICGKEFKRSSDTFEKECCSRKCYFEYAKRTGSLKESAQRGIQTKLDKYGVGSVHTREYKKICRFCGKEFIAHSPKAEVCKDVHTSVCRVCGKEFVISPKSTAVNLTCSRKCGQVLANESRKQTSLKRYGVDSPMKVEVFKQKLKDSFIENHGVDNPSKLEEVKKKQKVTFLEHYGVDNPMKDEATRKKQQDSVDEHYGARFAMQVPEIRKKTEQTNLEKYNATCPLVGPEIKQRILDEREARTGYRYVTSDPATKKKISEVCQEKYDVSWNCMRPECRKYSAISKINLKFAELLDAAGFAYQMEFNLREYSYDFYLPESNTLIEIDPTITHNSYLSVFPNSKPKISKYHFRKTLVAEQNGYRCIHVWDWDSWESIVQLLSVTTTLYARNCYVSKISKKDAEKFTSENHISGSCKGQSLCYGLFYEGELVEVMTFGSPRYNKNYNCELLRLCSLKGLRIIGGASKLFKKFLEENSDKSVISYCDRSKFLGSVYTQIGMKFERFTLPNKVWSKGDKRITQNLLNQRGFDQLLGTDHGKGTSNEELMISDGWLPVYDCGQLVYTYNIK